MGTMISCEAYLVYLDDFIILKKTFEENLRNIRNPLQKLETTTLKLNPSKCNLNHREVSYFEHAISAKVVKKDTEKTSAVVKQNCPENTFNY